MFNFIDSININMTDNIRMDKKNKQKYKINEDEQVWYVIVILYQMLRPLFS